MRRSLISIGIVLLLSFLALFSFLVYVLLASGDPQYWSSEIAEFERRDVSNPPPEGAVLFVGGRDLRLWNTLASDMAPIRTINRGFGDAQIAHATYYITRIVKPYRPRAVVLVAGGADLADVRGRRPEDVLNDLKAFVTKLRAEDIQAPVYFVSIRPAPMRSSRWFGMRRANALVEEYAKATPGLHYIEAGTPMLDERGNARDDLFRWDGLSLNAEGYGVLAAQIKPVLMRDGLNRPPAPPAPPPAMNDAMTPAPQSAAAPSAQQPGASTEIKAAPVPQQSAAPQP